MNVLLKIADFKKCIQFSLCLIFCLESLTSFSQVSNNLLTRADTITLLKQTICDRASITTQGIGIVGLPSRQWGTFVFLLGLLNTDELISLTKDSNPYLRFYSFLGLYYLHYPQMGELRKYLSNDTTQIYSIVTCVSSTTTVNKAINQMDIWLDAERITEFLRLLETDRSYKSEMFKEVTSKENDTFFY